MPGSEPADDGVTGPAQRGEAEQQIRLVGNPAAAGSGVRGGVGSRHIFWGRFGDAAARPVVRTRPEFCARLVSQTRIFALYQWARCIATMQFPPPAMAAAFTRREAAAYKDLDCGVQQL